MIQGRKILFVLYLQLFMVPSCFWIYQLKLLKQTKTQSNQDSSAEIWRRVRDQKEELKNMVCGNHSHCVLMQVTQLWIGELLTLGFLPSGIGFLYVSFYLLLLTSNFFWYFYLNNTFSCVCTYNSPSLNSVLAVLPLSGIHNSPTLKMENFTFRKIPKEMSYPEGGTINDPPFFRPGIR